MSLLEIVEEIVECESYPQLPDKPPYDTKKMPLLLFLLTLLSSFTFSLSVLYGVVCVCDYICFHTYVVILWLA